MANGGKRTKYCKYCTLQRKTKVQLEMGSGGGEQGDRNINIYYDE